MLWIGILIRIKVTNILRTLKPLQIIRLLIAHSQQEREPSKACARDAAFLRLETPMLVAGDSAATLLKIEGLGQATNWPSELHRQAARWACWRWGLDHQACLLSHRFSVGLLYPWCTVMYA